MALKLSSTQKYILGYFLKDPFSNGQKMADTIGYASSSSISHAIRGNTGMSRIELFVAIGWIQPCPVNYDTLDIHFRKSHRRVIDVLIDRPHATLQEIADAMGIAKSTACQYRSDIYKLIGISRYQLSKSEQQTSLLRLYDILGWYTPCAKVLED